MDTQEIKIRAKKISELDNFNRQADDNTYLVIGYNDGGNNKQNYKLSLPNLVSLIEEDASLNTIKNRVDELYRIINQHNSFYSITYDLNHISANEANPSIINYDSVPTLYFNTDNGYKMPDNIEVIGAEYDYNKNLKSVTIRNITSTNNEIIIRMIGAIDYYTLKRVCLAKTSLTFL